MKHNCNEKETEPEFGLRPDRMKILADHLQKGNIHSVSKTEMHEIWISESGVDSKKVEICVYPIYELVFLFPNEWKIDAEGFPLWIKDSHKNPISSFIKFFGINMRVLNHLLVPQHQNINAYGGKRLKANATPQDIAFNIYELIGQERAFQIFRMYPLNLN